MTPRKERTHTSQDREDLIASRKAVAFVSYHGPHRRASPAARRLIHQQAMKDIGKTRRKPKHTKSVELDLSLLHPGGQPDLAPASWWLGVRWTASDNLNLIAKFDVNLSLLEKTLIANIFQDDDQQRPMRDAWFSVAMTDEAAFMTVLSNSALHMSSIQKGGGRPAEETGIAITYQTAAVATVNQRLKTISPQDSSEAWDAITGAVSGLVCNSVIRGSSSDWKMHLQGMCHLIDLRGGVDSVAANEALRLTISWVEIQGAFMFDVSPIFPLPHQWHHSVETLYGSQDVPATRFRLRAAWNSEFPHENDAEWLDMFEQIQVFSRDSFEDAVLASARAHHFAGDTGAWTTSMIHRLLKYRPSPETLSSKSFRIREACRLGSLLYMVPVWRFFCVAPVASETLLAKLQNVLRNDDGAWGQMYHVHLWILYVGALEALDGLCEPWFLDQLALVSVSNGVKSWEEGMAIVKGVLWFACIFEARHAALQERMARIFEKH